MKVAKAHAHRHRLTLGQAMSSVMDALAPVEESIAREISVCS